MTHSNVVKLTFLIKTIARIEYRKLRKYEELCNRKKKVIYCSTRCLDVARLSLKFHNLMFTAAFIIASVPINLFNSDIYCVLIKSLQR